MKKVIKFYVREVYGNPLEYVVDKREAELLQYLTGKRTVNPELRRWIFELSGGQITFEQVFQTS